MAPSPLRRQLSSLWGAALAVTLATTFLSTLLLGMGQVGRSLNRVMAAGLGEAAIVVEPAHPIPDLSVITSYPGVSAAHRAHTLWCAISKPTPGDEAPPLDEEYGDTTQYASVEVQAAAPVPELETISRFSGPSPEPGQIGLTNTTAAGLGVKAGDTVRVHWRDYKGQARHKDLTFSSVLAQPSSFATNQIPALVNATDFDLINQTATEKGVSAHWATVLVAVDGADPQEVANGLHTSLGPDTVIYTAESWAENRLFTYTGTDRFTNSLTLSFAAMGVVVAGLVVATTFHVMVTRRTWELAIQRCMGATRKQLLKQVLTQALLLGSAASAIGVAVGHVIGQMAAVAAHGHDRIKLAAPGLLATPVSVIAPLLAGIAITVAAALPAARRASRTSPLTALRTQPQTRSSTNTLMFGGALILAGVSLLLIVAQTAHTYLNLGSEGFIMLSLMGIGGAVPLMVGMVVACQPALVWALKKAKPVLEGKSASRLRASTRIALLSVTRSPQRAGTTIGAVVVGVCLAIIVATGAQTAQSSLTYLFTASNPFDIEAFHAEAVDDADLAALSALPGVESVAAVHETRVAMSLPGTDKSGYGVLFVGSSNQIANASSDPHLELPAPGELLVSAEYAQMLGVSEGEQIKLAPFVMPAHAALSENLGALRTEDLFFPLDGPDAQLPSYTRTLDQFEIDNLIAEQAAENGVADTSTNTGSMNSEASTDSSLEAIEAELSVVDQQVQKSIQVMRGYIPTLEWDRAPTLTVRMVKYPPVINVDAASLAVAPPTAQSQSTFQASAAPDDGQSTSLPTLTNERSPLQNSHILMHVDKERARSLLPLVGPKIAERTNGQMPQIEGPVEKIQAYYLLIDRVLTLLVGLLFIAVIIAFVGVTNALVLSVVERHDEIATLRALGMSRKQVRLMLAIEGMVLASAGVVVGVLGGIPLGLLGSYTVLSRTMVFVADIPWNMVGATTLAALSAGVCAALLASSFPASRASRQGT